MRLTKKSSGPGGEPNSGQSLVGSARASRLALSILIAAIPAVTSLWMVVFHLGADPLDYAPQWSDEIYNWHQVATFRTAGFQGGYYTVGEEPAPLSFSHFYTHGPVYPALYGTLARLVGWEMYSAPIIGAVLTGLALLFFIYSAKLDRAQLALLGLLILTFWPMHLYMATDMRLSFFDAIAIALAASFFRIVDDPDRASRGFLVLSGLLIFAATLSKLTWSFLFFPYLLHIRRRIPLTPLQASALGGFLILIAFAIHNQLAAPYPNFAGELVATLRFSFAEGARLLMEHAYTGAGDFLDIDHHPLWLMVRLQMVVTIGWSVFLVARGPGAGRDQREGVVILVNSGLLVIMTVLLYDVFGWRDFRLFAPALLMTTLIFIARRRFVLVALLLAGNLAVLPSFIGAYETLNSKDRYAETKVDIEAFAKEITPTVRFDDGGDGWQNTILAPLRVAMNPRMLAIPAGIGISWFKPPTRLGEIKSRYLLLDPETRNWLGHRPNFEFIRKTALGDLYINHVSGKPD